MATVCGSLAMAPQPIAHQLSSLSLDDCGSGMQLILAKKRIHKVTVVAVAHANLRRSNAGHGIFAMPRRRHASVHCLVKKNQEISGAWRRFTMRALDEESSESNVAMEDRQLTPEEEEDQEDISNILKVVDLLKKKRDMTFNEVKLTIMIEDPREVERRKELGIEDDRGCSKEDMALALVEVYEGRIPEDRVVLRELAKEMLAWPRIEEEIAALNPAASPYAKMTPTGVDPKLAAQRARVDWDAATEFTAGEEPKDLSDMVPPAVGFSFLYLVSFIPVIIVVAVSGRLFTFRSRATPLSRSPWKVGHRQRRLYCAVRAHSTTSVPGFEDDMDDIFKVEDGIFEDTHLNPEDETPAVDVGAVKGNPRLVPEDWRLAQEEMGQTKKQKKRVILDTLKERSKQKVQQRRKVKTGGEGTRHTPFPQVLPGDLNRIAIPDKSNEDFNDDSKL